MRSLNPDSGQEDDLLGRIEMPGAHLVTLANHNRRVAGRSSRPSGRFQFEALLYLVALTLAEIVTVLVDTRSGVIGHALIFTFVVTQGAMHAYRAGTDPGPWVRTPDRKIANFFIALALVPLIRIVSLAMPLNEFPEWSWYALIAVPLLGATWAGARACGYSRREIGLRIEWSRRWWLVTLATAASGFVLGYIEYRILRPEPLASLDRPLLALLVSLTLLIGTGFTEEAIFRGVLQVAGEEALGVAPGIAYASLLFAMLHVGHESAWDVAFVFVVATMFGAIVFRTRSLAGVILAHGLTNVCLFLLFPGLLGG
jgi:membrane protease YdiL (CAAX protease family)